MQIVMFTLALPGAAFALPPANSETGGDPAPRLLPRNPPTAPAAAPPTDTSALLPPGEYVLRMTLKGETLEREVKLLRNGGAVILALGGNDNLNGSLDSAGKLQLAGGNATSRLALSAVVANRRATGQAEAGRGASRMNGSFTLDAAPQGARKLATFGAATPKKNEGFFDRLGKLWDCLKSWSTC